MPIAINCLEIWKYELYNAILGEWFMWESIYFKLTRRRWQNVQIHHHLQVTLATCYEKSVLNEEKKSYETALAEASKASAEASEPWPCTSQPLHAGRPPSWIERSRRILDGEHWAQISSGFKAKCSSFGSR